MSNSTWFNSSRTVSLSAKTTIAAASVTAIDANARAKTMPADARIIAPINTSISVKPRWPDREKPHETLRFNRAC
jgi:hypothetical protein